MLFFHKFFILFFSFFFFFFFFRNLFYSNDIQYIQSSFDNNFYLVQSLPNSSIAANILAKIKFNLNLLLTHLLSNINSFRFSHYSSYILNISNKFHNVVFSENSITSEYTSYSINKGEELKFCLRSKKTKILYKDFNLLMFVAIHELSHIACPEYNHTPLFWKIFKFLLFESEIIGIYKKIDFSLYPRNYCGIVISNSII
jgi:hypothetical protein